MIAEGTFMARASGPVQFVKSPEKGTPGLVVTFLLKDGPDAGQRVDWTPWLSENTEARIAESLTLMGYDGERDDSVTRNDVLVVVRQEVNPKDGKSYPRVAFVNDPNRARFELLAGAELTGVKQRLKAAAMASKKSQEKREGDPEF